MNAGDSMVYFMYHEIELPQRALCQGEPGYRRYVVREADFVAQMQLLQNQGLRGQSVGDALAKPRLPGVAITFDDGCETDFLIAAPLLHELGFSATFYITVGFLGKPGYLTRAQLRQLADQGCEIGSHSMTHPYLPDLAADQLVNEMAGSRKALSDITGKSIDHFSCPGGRYSPRVLSAAREAGYASVATSRVIANPAPAKSFTLGRVAVMRETNLNTFRQLARGRGLLRIRMADSTRSAAKRLLGNSTYDRIREQLLGHRPR